MRKRIWRRAFALSGCVLILSACTAPVIGQGNPTPTPLGRHQTPIPTPSAPRTASPTTKLVAAAPNLMTGEVSAAYPTALFSAAGGLGPYRWSLFSGTIPPGLNLTSDGVFTGTPTAAGSYAFTVEVADSGDSTSTASSSILIRPALAASLVRACATACVVESGCESVCGVFGAVSGGVGPYVFKVASGQTPNGTSLASNSMVLIGTFAGGACFKCRFTASVTDAYGELATLTPTYDIYPHISLAGGKCSTPSYLPACSLSLPWGGGIGTPTLTIIGAFGQYCSLPDNKCQPDSVPPFFSANVSGQDVLVSAAGGSGAGYTWSGTVTLELTDQATCTAHAKCSVLASVAVSIG